MNVHLTKHLPFCIKTHIYKEKDTLKCKLHELFGMNIYGSATLWFNTWRTNAGDCSLVPQAKNKTFFFFIFPFVFCMSTAFSRSLSFILVFMMHLLAKYIWVLCLHCCLAHFIGCFISIRCCTIYVVLWWGGMYLGEEACAFVGAFKEHLQMSTH